MYKGIMWSELSNYLFLPVISLLAPIKLEVNIVLKCLNILIRFDFKKHPKDSIVTEAS